MCACLNGTYARLPAIMWIASLQIIPKSHNKLICALEHNTQLRSIPQPHNRHSIFVCIHQCHNVFHINAILCHCFSFRWIDTSTTMSNLCPSIRAQVNPHQEEKSSPQRRATLQNWEANNLTKASHFEPCENPLILLVDHCRTFEYNSHLDVVFFISENPHSFFVYDKLITKSTLFFYLILRNKHYCWTIACRIGWCRHRHHFTSSPFLRRHRHRCHRQQFYHHCFGVVVVVIIIFLSHCAISVNQNRNIKWETKPMYKYTSDWANISIYQPPPYTIKCNILFNEKESF